MATMLLTGIPVGAIFGLALDKAHTNSAAALRWQMEMSDFTMMRMFLAASATSTFVVLVLDALGLKAREPTGGLALGFGKLRGYGANLLGGIVLGLGIHLSGSCPGTVWSQIGAGVSPTSTYTAAGCVLGALLFGYAEGHFRRGVGEGFHVRKAGHESDLVPASVPYSVGAVVVVAGMAGAVLAIDSVFPWQASQPKLVLGSGAAGFPSLSASSWDPALSGVALGMLQIPVKLVLGSALGQSSGWVYLSANVAALFVGESNLPPYLQSALKSEAGRFQVIVSAGIAAGSAASRYMAAYEPAAAALAASPTPASAFLGGVLIIIGARLGGGCTSGLGLSQFATLSATAVVGVAGMFAGGMAGAALGL